MHDPAIIEAAEQAFDNCIRGDEVIAVLTAVTPMIEAAALEKAAKVAEDCTADSRDGAYIAARIRALKA